jgi:hypothetical protein
MCRPQRSRPIHNRCKESLLRMSPSIAASKLARYQPSIQPDQPVIPPKRFRRRNATQSDLLLLTALLHMAAGRI